jgi:hypothetical protein
MVFEKLSVVRDIPENDIVFFVLMDIIDPETDERKTIFRTFRKETYEWFGEEKDNLPSEKEFDTDVRSIGKIVLHTERKYIEILICKLALGTTKKAAEEEAGTILKAAYPEYTILAG